MKLSILFTAILLCICSLLCAQEVVTVSSVGVADISADPALVHDKALEDALNGAVEFAVSTTLGPEIAVEHSQVLAEKIYSHSTDYVKVYKVVSETRDGGKEKIQITARVALTDLKKDLSPLLPTDSTTVHYRYDAWGNLRDPPDCAGNPNQLTCQNNLTYTGHTYDPGTGLYYYGARDYDPTTGRFITTDPATSLSKYHDYYPATAGSMVQVGTQMVPSSTMSQPTEQSSGCVVKTESGFEPCFGGSVISNPVAQNYAGQSNAANAPTWNPSAVANHPVVNTTWESRPVYAQAGSSYHAGDPAIPDSWNSYSYAMNSPTNYTDPLGLEPLTPDERALVTQGKQIPVPTVEETFPNSTATTATCFCGDYFSYRAYLGDSGILDLEADVLAGQAFPGDRLQQSATAAVAGTQMSAPIVHPLFHATMTFVNTIGMGTLGGGAVEYTNIGFEAEQVSSNPVSQTMRQQVLANIAQSKAARQASQIEEYMVKDQIYQNAIQAVNEADRLGFGGGSGGFGTTAHGIFEDLNLQLRDKLAARGSRFRVSPEEFRNSFKRIRSTRETGTIGIDAALYKDSQLYHLYDLKTFLNKPSPMSQARISMFQQRFGNVPLDQIFLQRP